MKNKAILSIFLLVIIVLVSSSVVAVKSLNITQDDVSIEGSSADTTENFSVQNTGNESINMTVTSSSITNGINTIEVKEINYNGSNVLPGILVNVQIKVDLDDIPMGIYFGTITAKVDGIPAVGDAVDTVPVIINVTDNGQSFVIISPTMNITESDKTVYQRVTVQNNANHDITVQVQKQGYDGMTFNLDKLGTQILPALDSVDILSSVQVSASKAPGPYTARVNASDGTTTQTANLVITVLSTYKASVSAVTINDVDPGETKSVNFNIQNTGNMDLTGLSLSNHTFLDNEGDRLNLTFSPSQGIDVAVGSSTTISAKADASIKMDPKKYYSQQVTLDGSGISETFTASVEINSILKITDVEVNPDELMPGEEFDVEVTIENVADDIDMEDVEIEIYIMDGNNVLEDEDDDDVEDDFDVGDLDEGEDKTETFTFRAPLDSEDGDSYGVKIIVKGENADDSSEKYKDERVYDDVIDVERPDDKVEIYKVDLDSTTLSCIKTTYIEVGLRNIGSNNQEVILSISNVQLGLREQENFDMDSDYDEDDYDVKVSKLLDFSSAPPGTYPVTILAENDDGEKLGAETVSVNVQECGYSTGSTTDTGTTDTTSTGGTTDTGTTDTGSTDTGSTSSTGTVDVVYTSGPDILGATVPAITAAPVVSKAKRGGVFDTPLGMAILVLGNLLLLILVIISLIYLVSGSASKGKRREQF